MLQKLKVTSYAFIYFLLFAFSFIALQVTTEEVEAAGVCEPVDRIKQRNNADSRLWFQRCAQSGSKNTCGNMTEWPRGDGGRCVSAGMPPMGQPGMDEGAMMPPAAMHGGPGMPPMGSVPSPYGQPGMDEGAMMPPAAMPGGPGMPPMGSVPPPHRQPGIDAGQYPPANMHGGPGMGMSGSCIAGSMRHKLGKCYLPEEEMPKGCSKRTSFCMQYGGYSSKAEQVRAGYTSCSPASDGGCVVISGRGEILQWEPGMGAHDMKPLKLIRGGASPERQRAPVVDYAMPSMGKPGMDEGAMMPPADMNHAPGMPPMGSMPPMGQPGMDEGAMMPPAAMPGGPGMPPMGSVPPQHRQPGIDAGAMKPPADMHGGPGMPPMGSMPPMGQPGMDEGAMMPPAAMHGGPGMPPMGSMPPPYGQPGMDEGAMMPPAAMHGGPGMPPMGQP